MKARKAKPPGTSMTIWFTNVEDYEKVKRAASRIGVSTSAFVVGEMKTKAEEVLGEKRCKECGRAHAA